VHGQLCAEQVDLQGATERRGWIRPDHPDGPDNGSRSHQAGQLVQLLDVPTPGVFVAHVEREPAMAASRQRSARLLQRSRSTRDQDHACAAFCHGPSALEPDPA